MKEKEINVVLLIRRSGNVGTQEVPKVFVKFANHSTL